MAKKKKNKFEELLSEEQQKKLQDLANEMISLAAAAVEEYDELDLSDISSLSSSLNSIDQITQIHEDSPYLSELFKGDSWKKIIKNIPAVPKTEDKKDNDTE